MQHLHPANHLVYGLLQVSVNEALVWRLVEVWNRLDLASLSRTGDDQQVQASTDTPVQISLVYCSDLTAAVRCALRSRCNSLWSYKRAGRC